MNYNYSNEGKELELVGYHFTYGNGKDKEHCKVIIPETITYMNRTRPVTSISEGAFRLAYSMNALVIGDSVRLIGKEAFWHCEYLESITFGKSVKKIGTDAFQYINLNNEHPLKMIIKDIANWCKIFFWETNSETNIPFFYKNKGALLYSDENTRVTNLIIPEGVDSIGAYCFSRCGVQSVTIPNSVKYIGPYAFYYSYSNSLKSIYIFDTSCWCNMNKWNVSFPTGLDLYLNGEKIIDIVIPDGVQKIKSNTFRFFNIESVTIPSSVTYFGSEAFGCSSLERVYISDLASWCNIDCYNYEGSSPLYYANNLYLNNELVTDLIIPNGVTSIGDNAFSCSCITSVTIPNSVTSIGRMAFDGSSLTSVTIPNSVTKIGDYAFRNEKLYNIVSLIEEPFQMNSFSYDQYMNCSLYVPNGTIDKYKSTGGWKKFVWIDEWDPLKIQKEMISNDEKRCYSLDGVKLNSLKNGINIIRHADGTTYKIVVK